MLTCPDICNAALVKLGCATESAGSQEEDVANTYYDLCKNSLLASYPWSFAVTCASLPIAKMPAKQGFDRAFGLPVDFLKSLSVVGATGGSLPYQIDANILHLAGGKSARLSYIKRVNESDFPSYFVSALINRLAAEFCLPLTGNAARSDLLFKLADVELKLAKLIDSQHDEPTWPEDFTVIEAHT